MQSVTLHRTTRRRDCRICPRGTNYSAALFRSSGPCVHEFCTTHDRLCRLRRCSQSGNPRKHRHTRNHGSHATNGTGRTGYRSSDLSHTNKYRGHRQHSGAIQRVFMEPSRLLRQLLHTRNLHTEKRVKDCSPTSIAGSHAVLSRLTGAEIHSSHRVVHNPLISAKFPARRLQSMPPLTQTL